MSEKYLIIKKGDYENKKKRFRNCQYYKIPYVVIIKHTKYADVDFDYITYPTEFDNIFKSNSAEMMKFFIEIFKKYADKKSVYTTNWMTLFFENMPLDTVELLASEIYDLVNELVEKKNLVLS